MIKQLKIFTLLSAFLVFFACSPSVYIPDPLDLRLVKYTEDGNNVGGALINDNIWTSEIEISFPSSNRACSITNYVPNDSLVVSFIGKVNNDERVAFHFSFKDLNITDIRDLLRLNDEKITINNISDAVTYQNNSLDETLQGGSGQIYFKSVKLIDEENATNNVEQVIISGTFSFVTPLQDITVTYGRFDYIIKNIIQNINEEDSLAINLRL